MTLPSTRIKRFDNPVDDTTRFWLMGDTWAVFLGDITAAERMKLSSEPTITIDLPALKKALADPKTRESMQKAGRLQGEPPPDFQEPTW